MSRVDVAALAIMPATDACRTCGNCCSMMPGQAVPADFGLASPADIEMLRPFLASGRWAIDWWDADAESNYQRVFYVRPAIAGATRLFDASWGGRCTFLGSGGCEAPVKPLACATLPVGRPWVDCRHPASKLDFAFTWLAYQAALVALGEDIESG